MYRVEITANGTCRGTSYGTKEMAQRTYDEIRAMYRRAGYTLVDAGGVDIESGLCELWIKEGYANRNIEIYAL